MWDPWFPTRRDPGPSHLCPVAPSQATADNAQKNKNKSKNKNKNKTKNKNKNKNKTKKKNKHKNKTLFSGTTSVLTLSCF